MLQHLCIDSYHDSYTARAVERNRLTDETVKFNWMTGNHTFGALASMNPARWNGWKVAEETVDSLEQHSSKHRENTRKGKKPIKLMRRKDDVKQRFECKSPLDAIWVVTLSAVYQLGLQAAHNKWSSCSDKGLHHLHSWIIVLRII